MRPSHGFIYRRSPLSTTELSMPICLLLFWPLIFFQICDGDRTKDWGDKNFLQRLDKWLGMAHPSGIMQSSADYSERVRQCAVSISESGSAALSGLYDLTATRLVRLATAITRNQHDAEDAVGTALVRVADDVHLLLRANHPWAYLLQMVRNEALLILRRKKRWNVINNITDLLTRRTVDQLEQEDQHRAVWMALRTLPAEQSEVVVLKIWEELTFAEIGEVLSVPPATAASRYRYALEKLATQLRHNQAIGVRHE